MAQVHAVIEAVASETRRPVEQLVQEIVDAGVRRITVVIGREGAALRARITRLLGTLPSDLDLAFFEERGRPDNVGAIGAIGGADDDVLLCCAGLMADVDVGTLIGVHRDRGHDVTLASHCEHPWAAGELVVDGDEVRAYQEKPPEEVLVFSGVAMFGSRALAVAREQPPPFGISAWVHAALGAGCSVTHWRHDTRWDAGAQPVLAHRSTGDAGRALLAQIEPLIRRQAG